MLKTKALWVEDLDTPAEQAEMLQQAAAIGANMLCVRTNSALLHGLIPTLKGQGFKVYGWRYPQTENTGGNSSPNPPNNSYAPNEAAYVANTLIPAGLDGYIMDIESDDNKTAPHPWLDCDRTDRNLTQLATDYANTLKSAGANCGRSFVLGLTSHANAFNIYPGTPWKPFIDVSDVLMPQAYWRFDDGNCVTENGGTPTSAISISYADYSQWRVPILPIGGEMKCSTGAEMTSFGQLIAVKGITEGHFYTSTDNIPQEVFAAIKVL